MKFQDVSTDSEQGSPAGAVVQRPLRYIERVDVKNIAEGSSDEALVRILITRHNTTGETTIGMSLSHILGEAFFVPAPRLIQILIPPRGCPYCHKISKVDLPLLPGN